MMQPRKSNLLYLVICSCIFFSTRGQNLLSGPSVWKDSLNNRVYFSSLDSTLYIGFYEQIGTNLIKRKLCNLYSGKNLYFFGQIKDTLYFHLEKEKEIIIMKVSVKSGKLMYIDKISNYVESLSKSYYRLYLDKEGALFYLVIRNNDTLDLFKQGKIIHASLNKNLIIKAFDFSLKENKVYILSKDLKKNELVLHSFDLNKTLLEQIKYFPIKVDIMSQIGLRIINNKTISFWISKYNESFLFSDFFLYDIENNCKKIQHYPLEFKINDVSNIDSTYFFSTEANTGEFYNIRLWGDSTGAFVTNSDIKPCLMVVSFPEITAKDTPNTGIIKGNGQKTFYINIEGSSANNRIDLHFNAFKYKDSFQAYYTNGNLSELVYDSKIFISGKEIISVKSNQRRIKIKINVKSETKSSAWSVTWKCVPLSE